MTRKNITVFGSKLRLIEVLPDEDEAMSIVRYVDLAEKKPRHAKVCTQADWREWDANARKAASIDGSTEGLYE